jgi:DHA3 family macrolide efflux protein-like MFS transporter
VLETQSSSILTIYVIVGVLPTFFTSLIGGVFADKYSKKALINISDGTIALVSLFIAISLSLGIDSIVLLLIAAGIRAFFQGIQQPTVNSLIPLIVPEEQLLRINGINSSIQSGIFMLSPIVAASLMSFTPLQTLFYIDVITASIAIIILIYLVRVPKNSKNDKEDTVKAHFAEMLDGIKYIRNHRFLLSLIIFQILFSISLTPAGILSVLQITKKFGPEV